jgi:hypothetical protein
VFVVVPMAMSLPMFIMSLVSRLSMAMLVIVIMPLAMSEDTYVLYDVLVRSDSGVSFSVMSVET